MFGLMAKAAPKVEADRDEIYAKQKKLADGLRYQQGEITLRGGLAKIRVANGFRYVDSNDANTVISQIWGNPPNSQTLGMLIPTDTSVASRDGWGVIITYDDDGYVKDSDADTIDYAKLLTQMQEGIKESNERRTKAGYAPIELIGWATPPRYDKAAHKMYWAKELKFGDAPENTLNYNMRILGRKGVLVLNAVAGMSQLHEIEAATPEILGMVDFKEGNRYIDFNSSTDKVATYGLAAMVAGGVLAKVGAFKGLIPLLLGMKKLIVVAFAGVAAFFKRLFGKKETQIR